MKVYFTYLLAILLFTGCFFNKGSKAFDEAYQQTEALNATSLEKSRQLTDAVVKTLGDEPELDRTPRSNLALNFAQQDQLIEGLPIEPMEVQDFIDLAVSEEESDLTKLDKKIDRLKTEIERFRKEKESQQQQLDAATADLVQKGKLWEEHNKDNFIKKIWKWSIGSFGLIGGIAFLVLCPTIAIPILTQLAAAIVKIVPSLAGLLGVAAKDTVDNVITGFQKSRKTFKESDKQVYTKDEVLKILDGEMNFAQTTKDKNFIRARKQRREIN